MGVSPRPTIRPSATAMSSKVAKMRCLSLLSQNNLILRPKASIIFLRISAPFRHFQAFLGMLRKMGESRSIFTCVGALAHVVTTPFSVATGWQNTKRARTLRTTTMTTTVFMRKSMERSSRGRETPSGDSCGPTAQAMA